MRPRPWKQAWWTEWHASQETTAGSRREQAKVLDDVQTDAPEVPEGQDGDELMAKNPMKGKVNKKAMYDNTPVGNGKGPPKYTKDPIKERKKKKK